MKRFHPRPRLRFPPEKCTRLTRAFQEKASLEAHSIRSAAGVTHAEAMLLMFQLYDDRLVRMYLRATDKHTLSVLKDIPFGEGVLPLPHATPYRDAPITNPDEVLYSIVVCPSGSFEVSSDE